MEIFGAFTKRLWNLRRIRDLEKLDNSEQKNYELNTQCGELDSSLSHIESLLHQQQNHTHLVNEAALSYWQCNKNSTKITMSPMRSNKKSH